MNPRDFLIHGADYGVPEREELVALRLWDTHFHGMYSPRPVEQYEQNSFYVERMGIERSVCLDIGIVGSTATQDNHLAETPQEFEIRAIRDRPNVYLEFSGSDPHSGSVEFAVTELGADRIVWGGHGPRRSYATEIGKVLDADLSRADRMKIFGRNYREYAAWIFRRKGLKLEV